MLRLDEILLQCPYFSEGHLPGTLCGHAHGSGRLQEQRVAGFSTGDGVSLIAVEN